MSLNEKAEDAVAAWQAKHPELIGNPDKVTEAQKDEAVREITEAIWGDWFK